MGALYSDYCYADDDDLVNALKADGFGYDWAFPYSPSTGNLANPYSWSDAVDNDDGLVYLELQLFDEISFDPYVTKGTLKAFGSCSTVGPVYQGVDTISPEVAGFLGLQALIVLAVAWAWRASRGLA